MLITEQDFENLTTSFTLLTQQEVHFWHRHFGRFENYYGERIDTPPRKEWKWGYWLKDGWATVMLARQFLIDNGHDFEVFYDTSFPHEWGGWVIFTDYSRE